MDWTYLVFALVLVVIILAVNIYIMPNLVQTRQVVEVQGNDIQGPGATQVITETNTYAEETVNETHEPELPDVAVWDD